jgi:asparagine synthase (glutamine-hydrolysing)
MSAIYGIIGEGDKSLLKSMGDRLSHRGSTVKEWEPCPGVFLGQRDPLNLVESKHSNIVVANASLYNRQEISELISGNDQQLNGSNPEFIQMAYEALGPDCFSRFNGDFVIALWDEHHGRLILARDPLGVKSVYYYQGENIFAFASEYKALLALETITPTPDLDVLQYFNSSKYLLTGKTLLKNVCSLSAGHWMEVKGESLGLHRYWDIPVRPKVIPMSTAEEELQNIFFKAVEKRIEKVKCLGVALSGGIDSSAVVAAIRKLRPNDCIKTFTIGSSEHDPEILLARKVASRFGTEHYEVIADPYDLLDDLEKLVWHLEDPVGRTEGYLYYRLMKVAWNQLDVIFGGSASDGLFAGMPKHKLIKMIQMFPLGRIPLEEFYHYTQLSYPPQSFIGKVARRLYFGRDELPAPTIVGASSIPSPRPLPSKRNGLLNHVLKSGLLEGVPGWMPKLEKTHMAYGVEFRTPFTDPEMVRYSFGLPEKYKMNILKEKYILRKALLPLIPGEIANRPKFPQRMEYDLRLSEVLDILGDKYLNPEAVERRGFYNYSEIGSLRNRDQSKPYSSNRAMRLWTAITTEIWAQIFLDGRGELL